MKILHLDSGESMRGGQYQLLLLMAGLEKRGVEQRLLAKPETLDRRPGRRLTVWNLLRAASWADLIHAHDARAHAWAAALSPHRPIVVSRRVAFPLQPGAASRWKYSRPRAYLAVSNYVGWKLSAAGVPREKVVVAPDGVAAPDEEPGPRSFFSPPRVLAVGTEDPLKCGPLALTACQLAGLELRFARDLEADLERADIFLYLTESEGLGSALLLAAVRKVPVIASRTGGVPELIRHEQTGLLVHNRAEAVAEALGELAADPDLARRLAEAGYRRAVEDFRDDIMVDHTEGVYRKVLGLPPRT